MNTITSTEQTKSFEVIFGVDENENDIVVDITKTPHLLISGATGSGKSNFIHLILLSLLKQNTPEELQLSIFDPKQVEFAQYEDVPHLLNIAYNSEDLQKNIQSIYDEVKNRFTKFRLAKVRDINEYNLIPSIDKIPRILYILDEFSDLAGRSNEILDLILRTTQLSRAAGIHFILSTQRPTTNIISGSIKANFPARVTFYLPSHVDSRTIIDRSGAEKLARHGEFIYSDGSEYIKAKATYIAPDITRLLTAELSAAEYSTLQSFIPLSAAINRADFTDKINTELEFNVYMSDYKFVLLHVWNIIIPESRTWQTDLFRSISDVRLSIQKYIANKRVVNWLINKLIEKRILYENKYDYVITRAKLIKEITCVCIKSK